MEDDVCDSICLFISFFLSSPPPYYFLIIISLLLFPYYYFLIIISLLLFPYYYFLIISFSDLVISNNSGRIAPIMSYHLICLFRVSVALIGSSVTSCVAKIPISLTKMSLLWRATPPPTTIIFNFALFQGLLFHLFYPSKRAH